ncbi:hypothetical protein CYMTET_36776 [Cymbomonas tetramitiformis]|uniref:Uncharacterized protein n=1 Tax=Cymbomonas tetramitiformis TaxID=36881 RepID=A0AAE0CHH7_9CHLO|nr:hypothetical protein CYMTET_36776 [Cymbomonas tetramitiformis]
MEAIPTTTVPDTTRSDGTRIHGDKKGATIITTRRALSPTMESVAEETPVPSASPPRKLHRAHGTDRETW